MTRPYIRQDSVCSECDQPPHAHGLCFMHYMRLRRHGDPSGTYELNGHGNRKYPDYCSVEGCPNRHCALGYCNMHFQRIKRLGHTGPVGKIVRGRYKDSNGYIIVRRVGNVKVLEHRVVMEQILGRELAPFENVHHLNGVRDDNRPENLELWTNPQPQGQRVSDLVSWVVANYPTEVAEALKC